MMQKEIWNETGDQFIRIEQAEAICGQDFCDHCGDCLHCYGDEPCIDGGKHRWVIYKENI